MGSSWSACSTLERAPTSDTLDESETYSYDDSSSAAPSYSVYGDVEGRVLSRESESAGAIKQLDLDPRQTKIVDKDLDVVFQERTTEDDVEDGREKYIRFSDLARPYCVFKDGLLTNPDVRVRVGPVIGKVTDTSAVVLLEVGNYSEVSLNFVAICGNLESSAEYHDNPSRVWQHEVPVSARNLETMIFTASGSVSVCHIMEPGKPCTFAVWGLEPATCYLVLLSGVSQPDQELRIARFRTMPERVESLRIVAICGQQAPEAELSDASPWACLANLACAGPEVQLVLHVGSTIDAIPAMAEAAAYLKDYASFKEGPRRDQERRACDALRNAYCEAWGRDVGLRRVLAEVGSHLTVFSPPCALEPLLRQLGQVTESAEAEAEEWRALLRSSLDIYYEYQRSLWHDASDSGVRAVKRFSRVKLSDDSADADYLDDLDERASFEFWQNVGGWSQGVVEEWHFHKYGRIGIFMLDTKGNRFRADGRLAATDAQKNEYWPLISAQQWTALQDAMQEDSMQVLVLASDIPYFVEAPILTAGDTTPPKNGKKGSPMGNFFDWCSRPKELTALLKMVFEWKQDQYPAREVVLISGGHSFGTSGDVCDHQYGLNIPLVITGPALGPVRPPPNWSLSGNVGGRFSYVYRAPSEHCNFCTVDIDLEMNPQKPTVDVQLICVPVPFNTQFPAPPESAGSIKLQSSPAASPTAPIDPYALVAQIPAVSEVNDIKSVSVDQRRESISEMITSVVLEQAADADVEGAENPVGDGEYVPLRQSEVLRMLN